MSIEIDNFDNIEGHKFPVFECCICKKKYKGYGNNPFPLDSADNEVDAYADKECCDDCNLTKVIPARRTYRE